MNIRKLLTFASLVLLVSILAVSCKEEDPIASQKLVADYSAEAALEWNKLFLEVERYAAGYRPGPAPRSLGLMGLAAYEACVTGMPDYNSLETQFNGLNIPDAEAGAEYHWPTVVHAVYTTMMPNFFPQGPITTPASVRAQWDVLVNHLNVKYAYEASPDVYARSKSYGAAVGLAVWEWSTTDDYGNDAYKNPWGNYTTNEAYNANDHYDAPGDWVSTVPGPPSGSCMGPYYGKTRTFALKDSEKLCLPPSAYYMDYSENVHSEYYSQALQTYTKNAHTDYTVEWIGEFWSDDIVNLTFSPGPRWTAIGNQIIENDNVDLERALEAYAKTGMALSDAAVGAWYSKYIYNIERPVTYINKFIDPAYQTNLEYAENGWTGFTPPFPAYPSGHSTMGGAGAEALASVFGYDYAMTDNCHLGRTEFEGVPRTFGSLYEMAVENSWSRVLLGVHWKMDCEEGVRFGTKIGRRVNALPWKK